MSTGRQPRWSLGVCSYSGVVGRRAEVRLVASSSTIIRVNEHRKGRGSRVDQTERKRDIETD